MASIFARESVVQAEIIKKLNRIPESEWYKTISGNRNGMPDIIGDIRGRTVYLEIKRVGGKATGLQEHTLHRARERGCCAGIVFCWEDVVRILTEKFPDIQFE